jgi:tetratricopeptide (TPR) repeat protein
VEHQLDIEWHGLAWVHAQLLRHPYLRPDLFEDIGASLDEGFSELIKAQADLQREFVELRATLRESTLSGVVALALLHFRAGRELNRNEDTLKSIEQLDRAFHLAEYGGDQAVLGRIRALRCGVKVLVGMLAEAIVDGREAVRRLRAAGGGDQHRFARGNLAYALYMNQDYDEAKQLLMELVPEFEDAGEFLDVVRTVQHLTELTLARREYGEARIFARRLAKLSDALQQFGHRPGEMGVALLGTLANVHVDLGSESDDDEQLRLAEQKYLAAERAAELLGLDRMAIHLRGGRAKCLWFLDRLDEADSLFQRVAQEAMPRFGKTAADAIFNRAFLLRELGRIREAAEQFVVARERYRALGDLPSVSDAERELARTLGAV